MQLPPFIEKTGVLKWATRYIESRNGTLGPGMAHWGPEWHIVAHWGPEWHTVAHWSPEWHIVAMSGTECHIGVRNGTLCTEWHIGVRNGTLWHGMAHWGTEWHIGAWGGTLGHGGHIWAPSSTPHHTKIINRKEQFCYTLIKGKSKHLSIHT